MAVMPTNTAAPPNWIALVSESKTMAALPTMARAPAAIMMAVQVAASRIVLGSWDPEVMKLAITPVKKNEIDSGRSRSRYKADSSNTRPTTTAG